MEGWIILGAVIMVAVALAAVSGRRVRRRGALPDTTPDQPLAGPVRRPPVVLHWWLQGYPEPPASGQDGAGCRDRAGP